MRRAALYSSSRSLITTTATTTNRSDQLNDPHKNDAGSSDKVSRKRGQWRRLKPGRQLLLWAGAGGLLVLLLALAYTAIRPQPRQISQEDIRAAVLHTLQTDTLPSPVAKAYEVIRPSI